MDLPNFYPLPDRTDTIVHFGREVSGPGGHWVPHVVEVSPGQFVAAIFDTAPGSLPVGFEPVGPDRRKAARLAAKLARLAAA